MTKKADSGLGKPFGASVRAELEDLLAEKDDDRLVQKYWAQLQNMGVETPISFGGRYVIGHSVHLISLSKDGSGPFKVREPLTEKEWLLDQSPRILFVTASGVSEALPVPEALSDAYVVVSSKNAVLIVSIGKGVVRRVGINPSPNPDRSQ